MEVRTHHELLVFLALGAACPFDPVGAETEPGATDAGSTSTSGGPGTGSTTAIDTPTTGTSTASTTSTTSGVTTTTSTGPIGLECGDGTVAGAEECDLGAANANTGACTLECKQAVCGDGLVWAGHEECDFGLGNDLDYGGCQPQFCQWGPRCGDGAVDVGHEVCDRGELNGTGMTTDEFGPCSLSCGFFGRIMFLTSEEYDGALQGVSGGDLKCRNAALAAGLPNAASYRAWLSDEAMAPENRYDAWDDVGIPLILLDGLVVADDFVELVDLGPRTGIARTELGQVFFTKPVWTNTSAFGEVFSAANHCAGWTSSSELVLARVGLNALEVEEGPAFQTWRDQRQWTSAVGQKCNKLARLYCIDDGVILEEEG